MGKQLQEGEGKLEGWASSCRKGKASWRGGQAVAGGGRQAGGSGKQLQGRWGRQAGAASGKVAKQQTTMVHNLEN